MNRKMNDLQNQLNKLVGPSVISNERALELSAKWSTFTPAQRHNARHAFRHGL
jgi:hypothetical protein